MTIKSSGAANDGQDDQRGAQVLFVSPRHVHAYCGGCVGVPVPPSCTVELDPTSLALTLVSCLMEGSRGPHQFDGVLFGSLI
jgi:hypothetical protein